LIFGKLNIIVIYTIILLNLLGPPLSLRERGPKKHVSYLRWLKVHDLVKDKNHLTESGIEIIKEKIKFIHNKCN
jgi:hypothetical protein